MFRLENLTAREGARTVMPWVTPLTSSVVALDKANALFVTDSLANLQQLDNIFSRIDRVGDVQDAILWFQPKNASVESLKASFEDLQKGALKYYLLGNTSFASDKNTNSFIVVTPKGNEPMIREFVEKLDATVDPLVQHHVFRIQHGSSKEITELIKKLMSQQKETNSGTQANASTAAFSEKLSIECDERLNAIVAYGTPSDIRQIQNLLNQLDVVLPQIRLEVVIAEVRLTDGQASGLESFGFKHGDGVITRPTWNQADGKESKDYVKDLTNQVAPGAASIPGVTSPILSGLVNWGRHSMVTIDGVLNAAKTKQNIKIVSSPTLLTTHAREATLSVVETRPYIKALQTKAGSGSTDADVSNSTVDQVDAGIVLTIKPWIGTDGTVQLEIDQKIDNFTANSMAVGSSNNRVTIPYINKRQLKSFVSAKSGEMIVLGGLKKKETTRTKRKTFLLGDIPGIGELFTGKGKSEETTEMIVFIRPVLLQNNDAVRADTELYKENLTSKTRDEVNAYEETGRFSDKPEMDEDDKRKQRIKELKAERKAEAEEASRVRKEKRMQARAERAERQAREESASRASRRAHVRKTSVARTTQTNVSEVQTSRRGHIRRAHRAVAEPKVQAQQAVQSRRASRTAVRKARQTVTEPTKSEVNRPRVRAHRRR
jgi:general secretion pathway protein D